MQNIFALKYWSEKKNLKKSGGTLDRLSTLLKKSSIDLHPYQIESALYAFNSPLSRGCILADEVGLGKTIEAGLVIAQLVLEDKKHILIIAPASLRTQWQSELSTHFGLDSLILDAQLHSNLVDQAGSSPLIKSQIIICSYQFAYKMSELISRQHWDLVVIDEAHRLRSVYRGKDSKMAYTLRSALQDKPKLLLTATPLQNNLLELYGLVSFIDEKLLGNQYYFQTRYAKKIAKDPAIAQATIDQLRNLLLGNPASGTSGVVNRTLRRQVKEYVNFTTRHSMTYDFTPTISELKLYNLVSDYLRRENLAAIATPQRSLMILVYRKLLASSSFAIAPTLAKLRDRLRGELIRRHAPDSTIPTLLDNSDELIVSLTDEQIISEQPKKTLADFSDQEIEQESDELDQYYKLASSIKENAKAKALQRAVFELLKQAEAKQYPTKLVIFTESTRTQEHLAKLLGEQFGIVTFNGQNNGSEVDSAYHTWANNFPEKSATLPKNIAVREALVHAFKTNPSMQIFLTTEAGSEGLNLQFANILINFDLPWNPQRVEQRIGRVHRYGQTHEVIIANFLNTSNLADKRVLELLRDKLGLFDGLFGSSDEILGNLEDGEGFEQQILNIYQNAKSPDEIESAFKSLQSSLHKDIDTKMHEVREHMLDHFDADIIALFNQTQAEIHNTLSEHDTTQTMLTYYGYHGEKIETNPIPITSFSDLSSHLLERLNGATTGMIYVFKLTVKAVETEEVLIPMVFVNRSSAYIPLDPTLSRELTESISQATGETLGASPVTESVLLKTWTDWKKPIFFKYEKRNEHLYSREMERIYRYWDNHSLETKDTLGKTRGDIEELRRRRDATLDFASKRKIDQQIQSRDLTIQKLLIRQNEEESEAIEGKRKDLDLLNAKLDCKFSDELVAIAQFKII